MSIDKFRLENAPQKYDHVEQDRTRSRIEGWIGDVFRPLRSWRSTPPAQPVRQYNSSTATLDEMRKVIGQLIADLGEKPTTFEYKDGSGVDPLVDNPAEYTGTFLDIIKSAGPTDPTSDRLRLYAKNDGLLYYKNSDGDENWVASSSRNRVINPTLGISQTGVGPVTDGAYTGIDQYVALTQSGSVTSSQLTAVTSGVPSLGRLTQSQATAQRFGWLQPLESVNVLDLLGKTVSLGAKVRMSATATLRYAIIEWNGTADAIAKDVVADWTNANFTIGKFFALSNLTIVATGSTALSANVLTDIALSGVVSNSMKNLLLFFWTDSAQAQNVTLDLGNVWFGQGAIVPAIFDPPSPMNDIEACLRYWCQSYNFGTAAGSVTDIGALVSVNPVTGNYNEGLSMRAQVVMRTAPSVTVYGTSGAPGKASMFTAKVDVPLTVYSITNRSFRVFVNNASTNVADQLQYQFIANARL